MTSGYVHSVLRFILFHTFVYWLVSTSHIYWKYMTNFLITIAYNAYNLIFTLCLNFLELENAIVRFFFKSLRTYTIMVQRHVVMISYRHDWIKKMHIWNYFRSFGVFINIMHAIWHVNLIPTWRIGGLKWCGQTSRKKFNMWFKNFTILNNALILVLGSKHITRLSICC